MILLIVGFHEQSFLSCDIISIDQKKYLVENFFSYRNQFLVEESVFDGKAKECPVTINIITKMGVVTKS